MRIATATLESVSPYSQNRCFYPDEFPKKERELPDKYEGRTWQHKCHVDAEGNVFIPPTQFKKALENVARYLSIQIPSKGKATYTKHFMSGILVTEPLVLPVKIDDVVCDRVFVPADGSRGGSRRVWKMFPLINSWKGNVRFYVLDEIITEDVFKKHIVEAGRFIGLGRFRPQNGGFYGRFKVSKVKWSEEA